MKELNLVIVQVFLLNLLIVEK